MSTCIETTASWSGRASGTCGPSPRLTVGMYSTPHFEYSHYLYSSRQETRAHPTLLSPVNYTVADKRLGLTHPTHLPPPTRLYMAPDLLGPWTEHPASPLAIDPAYTRPGGRPVVHKGKLYRYACKRLSHVVIFLLLFHNKNRNCLVAPVFVCCDAFPIACGI